MENETNTASLVQQRNKNFFFVIIAVVVLLFLLVIALIVITQISEKRAADAAIPESLQKNRLAQQAQDYFSGFSKTSLTQSFQMPANTPIQPTKNAKGEITNANRYTATWNPKDTQASAAVLFQDISVFDTVYFSFTTPTLGKETVATASALLATAKYFSLPPGGQWKCNTQKKTCENFWQDSHGIKHGIGINTQYSLVFYCEIYPQSKSYTKLSCF